MNYDQATKLQLNFRPGDRIPCDCSWNGKTVSAEIVEFCGYNLVVEYSIAAIDAIDARTYTSIESCAVTALPARLRKNFKRDLDEIQRERALLARTEATINELLKLPEAP